MKHEPRVGCGVALAVIHVLVDDAEVVPTVLIVIAATLTIWSMIYYLQKALPEIRAKVR